ncbi:MAG: DUF2922 domain-containing protein [Synergistaceae bacterium]|jgi:hypothetical protein|nr:DUF2922 domain-containing protein [Synergistaceae bacterium]
MATDTRTLSMKFETGDGKTRTISISCAAENIGANDVSDAMDAMIGGQVFTYGLSAKLGAQIVQRTVDVLF